MTVADQTVRRGRLTPAVVGFALALALAGGATATALDSSTASAIVNGIAVAFAFAILGVVGAVVTLAVPSNRVGWLLLAAAAMAGVGMAATNAGVQGVQTGPGVSGAAYLAAIGPAVRQASWVLVVVALPALFPDGRLPGPRWRWLGWCVTAAIVCSLLSAFAPGGIESRLTNWDNPLASTGWLGSVENVVTNAGPIFTVLAEVGAVAGLIARWRRGSQLARQQLVLFALAACPPVLVGLAIVASFALPPWVFGVAMLGLPIAIANAALSYGLYDLRRAANRALVWLFISGSLAGIYIAVVLAAAALVPQRGIWWAVPLAAAVISLVLFPLRASMQGVVNRVVYGRWSEPYEVLTELGRRLEAAADADRVLDATITELTGRMDLRQVGIRGLDGSWIGGFASEDCETILLQAYSATVGWLCYEPPARGLSPAERGLLRDLGRQLGGVLHAHELRSDLHQAMDRMVRAREEERRRLRRDLHDDIGPALAGLTLKAEIARAHLPTGADESARQLDHLVGEIRRTVVDVRRLVEGLRPPALDNLGLIGACSQAITRLTAGTPVLASIEAPSSLPPLPAAVEVAAYRIVVEAVTNVMRHSQARRCQIALALTPPSLSVTIRDDGAGFGSDIHSGNGLAIMRERAEEIGGTLVIADSVAHVVSGVADRAPGVTVTARLPVTISAARPALAASP